MIEHEALNAHSQKSGIARGVHRGRIIRIKMAATEGAEKSEQGLL